MAGAHETANVPAKRDIRPPFTELGKFRHLVVALRGVRDDFLHESKQVTRGEDAHDPGKS
jgi:hypothetical protein